MQQGTGPATKGVLPPLRAIGGMDKLLEGRVGIVTGASRGIGEATATAMADAGAKVVLASRNAQALEEVAAKINLGGERAYAVAADVTERSAVERLVAQTVERYGRLDMAFNNAGEGHRPAPLADLSVEDFDRSVATNAKGVFLSMKYEVPAMLSSGGGSIVNMSSTAGLQGVSGIAGYAAGKHAVIGLTRAAALDYADARVRVNAVAPGPILSERVAAEDVRRRIASGVPLARIGDREEVAATVVWLLSDLSSFVTGTVVTVDGGMTSGVKVLRAADTSGAATRESGQGIARAGGS